MVCKFRAAQHATVNDSFEVFHCDHFGTKCTEENQGLLTVLGDPLPVCGGCKVRAEIVPAEGTGTKSKFCYWSCDTTPNGAAIIKTLVASARAAGVQEDFHVFANRPVPGATVHSPGKLDIKYHIFKWRLLAQLASLDYEYFVWLDSDNYFVRHPGNLKNLICGNAMWCQLESETTSSQVNKDLWWGMPVARFNQLLSDHGVTGEKRYNTNGGMWIVRKEAIATFVREALAFHAVCVGLGFHETHDETPLAWLGQLEHMSGYGPWVADKHLNTNPATCETWACQWMGSDRPIPDGHAWSGEDYMTGEKRTCNPAIVHAMRSKKAMANASKPPAGFAPCAKLHEVKRTDECEICGSAAGAKGVMVDVRCCEEFEECASARYKQLSIHQPQVCNRACPEFVDKNALVQLS
ncbi:MAG: hypothetical protein JWP89_2685 [Schlesneria sp.]|nr:hypothetical protein [Schlesneria sp.]